MINTDKSFLTAQRLRQDLGLSENSYVDLDYVAEKLMIKVRRVNLGEGIEGACKSEGIKRLIVLTPFSYSEEKERFTFSHEIGHLLIHHGSHYCNNDYFNTWQTQNSIEKEANDFAAELLLPKKTLISTLKKKDLSFALVKEIAKTFRTTISVAIIRLVSLYDDCVVAIRHDGQKIFWVARSQHCFLKISSIVSPLALANNLDSKNTYIRENINSQYWLDEEVSNLICEEETHYFSKLKQYLTILKFYEDD